MTIVSADLVHRIKPHGGGEGARVAIFPLPGPWMYVITAGLVALGFVADVILPRGATAAIVYCLVPVILAGTRPRVLLGATILCTVLTIAGFCWEPPGAMRWMSVFDRVMVGGVLWLTFLMTRRRGMLTAALEAQAKELTTTTAELRRSNADLERFASTVAHDLRAPLCAIQLLAELLARSGSVKADAEAIGFVGSIGSELKRMSGFITRLLEYGRAGAREIRLVDCDCSTVLQQVRQSLKAELEAHHCEIISEPLPLIQADPILIERLLQNVVENGIKYRSEAPPRIEISATADAREGWLFSVRDNGMGISSEDRANLFAPFHQLGSGHRTTGGVGLGLATCKRIVERHGGRIWVESKPGEGTTFLFTIPQKAAADQDARS